jgi:lysophospholipase L1-like esterase
MRCQYKRPVKVLIASLVVGLTACGSSTAFHSVVSKDLEHNPIVAFVGDPLVTAWISQQSNPMWFNFGSPAGVSSETSTSVLARLPAALVGHPDVVVILVGTFDIDPGWSPYCDPGGIATCTNLVQMIALAHAAGSKVVLCNLPVTLDTGSGAGLYDNDPELQGAESVFDETIALQHDFVTPGWTEDAYIDLADALASLAWTDDGVTPNALGAATMSAAVEAVMPKVGGLK